MINIDDKRIAQKQALKEASIDLFVVASALDLFSEKASITMGMDSEDSQKTVKIFSDYGSEAAMRHIEKQQDQPDRLVTHLKDLSLGLLNLAKDDKPRLSEQDKKLVRASELFAQTFTKNAEDTSSFKTILKSVTGRIIRNCENIGVGDVDQESRYSGTKFFNRKGLSVNIKETLQAFEEAINKHVSGRFDLEADFESSLNILKADLKANPIFHVGDRESAIKQILRQGKEDLRGKYSDRVQQPQPEQTYLKF